MKVIGLFLNPGIAPLAFVAIGMWIWAELKLDIRMRIFYGALALLLCLLTLGGVMNYSQGYERKYVRESLSMIKEQMLIGNAQQTADAINKFEKTVGVRDFMYASSGLWSDLHGINRRR